jgi:hypothetical protein
MTPTNARKRSTATILRTFQLLFQAKGFLSRIHEGTRGIEEEAVSNGEKA